MLSINGVGIKNVGIEGVPSRRLGRSDTIAVEKMRQFTGTVRTIVDS